MASNKELYRTLCENEPSIPVFSQHWWLDAVCGAEKWHVVLVEKGGVIHASLPYFVPEEGVIAMPRLTPSMGPWLRQFSPTTKYSTRLGREKDLITGLLDQLPECGSIAQNLSPALVNWLPWYWKGFSQTTRYTYILEDLSDHDAIYKEFQTNIRGDIRKAKKNGIIVERDAEPEEFIRLNQMTFERQGKPLPYSKDFVRTLDEACAKRDARKIFVSRDPQGRAHAGVYIVYNRHCAYNLMIGGDPELRNSGATSLAVWEAIKFSNEVSNSFDFEGSMIEPVERFFRAFGARQTPYFTISKASRAFRLQSAVKDFLGKMASRLKTRIGI